MKKYFNLQLKRLFTVLPYVTLVTVAMLVFAAVVVVGLIGKSQSDVSNQKLKIAITGDTEGDYIELGMMALQNFDDTRFAMELLKLDEKEAEESLRKGSISAYVVLPEDFIEGAINGKTETVTFVTSAGSQTVATLLKNEITELITDIVVYSQKGIHAVGNACVENGAKKLASENVRELSIEYTTLVFSRGELCTLEELGISNGIDFCEYYICAVSMIFLTLIGIAFATVYVKKDHAFGCLFTSKGYSVGGQMLCETATHFFAMVIQILTVVIIGILAFSCFGYKVTPYETSTLVSFGVRLIFITVVMTTFNMFMFEISGNLVTAVLLYFFFSLGQCYVSGCFYPIYALPVPIQKIASYLPFGSAREFLEGAFMKELQWEQLVLLLIYASLFTFGAIQIRKYKTTAKRG